MISIAELSKRLSRLGYSTESSNEIIARYISIGLIDELIIRIEREEANNNG